MDWEPKDDAKLKALKDKIWEAELAVEKYTKQKVAEVGFAAAKKFKVPPAKAAKYLRNVAWTHTQDPKGERVHVLQIAAWMFRHNKTITETRKVYGDYMDVFGDANVGMIADILRNFRSWGTKDRLRDFQLGWWTEEDLSHVGYCMELVLSDTI